MSQLNILLIELQDLMMKMVTKKCGKDSGTCGDWKMELEVDLHRTKESVEHAELRLKQVEQQSKQEIDKLQDIKCKVIHTKILSILCCTFWLVTLTVFDLVKKNSIIII